MKIDETTIQSQVVNWCRKNDILVWATPNGSKRDLTEAVRLKREGVLAGVPDLFFPELFMFMELKTTTGRLSEAQSNLIDRLEKNYKVYFHLCGLHKVYYLDWE